MIIVLLHKTYSLTLQPEEGIEFEVSVIMSKLYRPWATKASTHNHNTSLTGCCCCGTQRLLCRRQTTMIFCSLFLNMVPDTNAKNRDSCSFLGVLGCLMNYLISCYCWPILGIFTTVPFRLYLEKTVIMFLQILIITLCPFSDWYISTILFSFLLDFWTYWYV